MNAKTKQVSTIEKNTTPEVKAIGPIVAIQYPTKVDYSETEVTAKELAVKYGHLKQLDVDNKEGYSELVAAIADIRARRTDVKKQEDVIKNPLNDFRKIVIDLSKKVRGLLQTTEDSLKAEKVRIDDIKAERKQAQRRLWQANLNTITAVLQTIGGMDKAALISTLSDQNMYDFEALDFGEWLEQAKSSVAQNIVAITERLNFIAEQEKLRLEKLHQSNLHKVNCWSTSISRLTDEQLTVEHDRINDFDLGSMEFGNLLEQAREAVEFALQACRNEYKRRAEAAKLKIEQEEAESKRIAEQKKRDEEKAASDKKADDDAAEMQRMRDQIAAMQKASEPKPEPEPEEEIKPEQEANEEPEKEAEQEPYVEATENIRRTSFLESVQTHPKPKESEEADSLARWILELDRVKSERPQNLSPNQQEVVEQVASQLDHVIAFLESKAK